MTWMPHWPHAAAGIALASSHGASYGAPRPNLSLPGPFPAAPFAAMLWHVIDLLRMTSPTSRFTAASFTPASPAGATPGPAEQPRREAGPPAPVHFSIVIPLHDKARYVMATLGSVLAQTDPDFEVIVVDDGSRDEGPALVAAIQDPRVRLVRQANAGVSVARNLGISIARGEWVAFLDADDWHHPRYLEQLRRAQQLAPDADVVAARFVTFTDAQAMSAPLAWDVPGGDLPIERITDLPTRWMQGPTLFTGSVAVRRALLERMQPCFPPGESFGEDLDLWFRVGERSPIALVHAPLAAYRTEVGGSLSAQHDPRDLPPWVERMRDRVRSGALPADRARSTLVYVAQMKIDMARHAVVRGERLAALRWLWDARRIARTKRWWFTATMILLFPGKLVRSYMDRTRRNPLQPSESPAGASAGSA